MIKISKGVVYSTSSNDDEAINNSDDSAAKAKLEKKIAGRKKRVDAGYKLSASAYALVTCIALTKYRSIPIPALFLSSGPFMASSIAFHLIGSGPNDCLQSGASKRLNLALASFGFIGLLSKDIITTAKPLWIFGCLVAMINSIKGYGYGLKGWDLKMMEGNSAALGDIAGGIKSSLAAVVDLPSGVYTRSAGYAALAITFHAMALVKLYKIVAYVVEYKQNIMRFQVLYPLLFRFKKLLLLSVAAFTLKEAVDQKDVGPKGWGATPFGLGVSTSVVTGIIAAHCITQGSIYLGGWLAFLALFSAFDGLKVLINRSK